ncbi:MAG: glutaredoxin [Deltaproteobacteria bacterium]|nr:glutaredoxin [Deltaproteobacteria bacterium]
MDVELAVTRSCYHCPILQAELKKLGIPYSIRYLEDDPELQKRLNVKGSPNILVDGELVFRGMPTISELERYFQNRRDD